MTTKHFMHENKKKKISEMIKKKLVELKVYYVWVYIVRC